MFCQNFINAARHGSIRLGDMTDEDKDTIYLDFEMKVNGTAAKVNYCPFCSRIVRGRYDLAAVQEIVAASHELPDEMFDEPF